MPTRAPTAIELIKANYGLRRDIQAELRTIDEAAADDGTPRPYTEDEATKIAEFRTQLEEVDSRLTAALETEVRSQEIERGLGHMLDVIADRDSGEVRDVRSIGARFTEVEGLAEWISGGARGNSPSLETATEFRVVTDTTLGATSGGAFAVPDRLDRVGQSFLDRRVYLLDLIPSIPVGQGSVEIVQDQSPLADLANKAAEVAEGAAKPQAGITLAKIIEPVATIAAWVNITRQTLEDVPQIQGYVDGRLRYSIKRRGDAQAINGDGTGANLRGLANRAGIITYAPVAAEARYKSIRRGIRLMEDAETVPEIVVLNPADAELFDLSNEATAGLHAVPNVAGPSARTTWGLTQVRSTAVAAGTALLIDPMAVALLDRKRVAAHVTDSHAALFVSNILTLLLEARLGLALFEAAGVAKLTFNGAV